MEWRRPSSRDRQEGQQDPPPCSLLCSCLGSSILCTEVPVIHRSHQLSHTGILDRQKQQVWNCRNLFSGIFFNQIIPFLEEKPSDFCLAPAFVSEESKLHLALLLGDTALAKKLVQLKERVLTLQNICSRKAIARCTSEN